MAFVQTDAMMSLEGNLQLDSFGTRRTKSGVPELPLGRKSNGHPSLMAWRFPKYLIRITRRLRWTLLSLLQLVSPLV